MIADKHFYSFAFQNADEDNGARSFTHNFELPFDVSYHQVAEHLSDFLSAVYGYRITLEATGHAYPCNPGLSD